MGKAIDVNVEQEPQGPPESYFVPATDVYQTDDELVLVADMPGVPPEGLDVRVEEGVLTLRGSPAGPEAEGEVLLEEFAGGEYYRSFRLPGDYDTDKIQASVRQGVLMVRLPKSERLKPRKIEIQTE
jgi:HSP20 family molecular chaperone IbpA